MKSGIVVFGLLLLVLSACSGKKKTNTPGTVDPNISIAQSKHSDAFNNSVGSFMQHYYAMNEGFVNWDTTEVAKQSKLFKASLDSFKIEELKNNQAAYDAASKQWGSIKAELSSIIAEPNFGEKKYSLNILSQLLFEMLKTVQYDRMVIYYQECPMALDNYENSAYWLSKYSETEQRRNPYLGLHDPKYKSGMLKCGKTQDSVNFVTVK
jgi:hypothetical protein